MSSSTLESTCNESEIAQAVDRLHRAATILLQVTLTSPSDAGAHSSDIDENADQKQVNTAYRDNTL